MEKVTKAIVVVILGIAIVFWLINVGLPMWEALPNKPF